MSVVAQFDEPIENQRLIGIYFAPNVSLKVESCFANFNFPFSGNVTCDEGQPGGSFGQNLGLEKGKEKRCYCLSRE